MKVKIINTQNRNIDFLDDLTDEAREEVTRRFIEFPPTIGGYMFILVHWKVLNIVPNYDIDCIFVYVAPAYDYNPVGN